MQYITKKVLGNVSKFFISISLVVCHINASPATGAYVSLDTENPTDTETETQNFNTTATAGNYSYTDDGSFTISEAYTGWYSHYEKAGAPTDVNLTGISEVTPGVRNSSVLSSGRNLQMWRNNASIDGAWGSKPQDSTGDIYTAVKIRNNTGAAITGFEVNFAVEQWYSAYNAGGPYNNQLTFAYQVTAGDSLASLTTGNWTRVSSLDFNSIYDNGDNASDGITYNGNLVGNYIEFSNQQVNGLYLANGSDLWIRWFDNNSTGIDHAMAIDNFTIKGLYGGTVWDDGAGDDNWTSGTNWVDDVAPTSGADEIIKFTQTGAGGTVTLDSARTIGSLIFDNNTAVDLSGANILTFDVTSPSPNAFINIGASNAATHTITVNNIDMQDDLVVSNEDTPDFVISSAIDLNANTLTLDGSGGVTLSGVISDGGSVGTLTQQGSGTLILSGTNTYIGDTTVSAGTLDLTGSIDGKLNVWGG